MLTVQNLSFRYPNGQSVLNDISLSADKGQLVAILGGSGTGKSTLLRLIAGLIDQTTPTIQIDGASPLNFRKQGRVGFMFQEPVLLPYLSVKDNITFPLSLRIHHNAYAVDKLLQIVGLEAYQNYMPGALSGGMKSRVDLARTFITKPDLILLDEPFSKLDVGWKFSLYRELETLRRETQPLTIMVTHDLEEALILADRIIVLGRSGRMIGQIEVEQIGSRVDNPALIDQFQHHFTFLRQLILSDHDQA